MNFKHIHIGEHLQRVSQIRELSISRACVFLKCSKTDIQKMYLSKTLESDVIMRWCKLLNYNFFMLYNSHLQIFKPNASTTKLEGSQLKNDDKKYIFKKNLYSPEVIEWLYPSHDVHLV